MQLQNAFQDWLKVATEVIYLVLAHHGKDGVMVHTITPYMYKKNHTLTQIKNQNQNPRTIPKTYVGDVDCRV